MELESTVGATVYPETIVPIMLDNRIEKLWERTFRRCWKPRKKKRDKDTSRDSDTTKYRRQQDARPTEENDTETEESTSGKPDTLKS